MAQTLILLKIAVETGRQQDSLDDQQIDSFHTAELSARLDSGHSERAIWLFAKLCSLHQLGP